MPTLSSMRIPPPTSWDEFEDITLSSLKIKWTSPNLVRYGRQGQPQQGVDIYGEDDLGRCVGVQCKLTENNLDISSIRREVTKARKFRPNIEAFYIATTALADARLQQRVRLLSSDRVKRKQFPIGIFFWHDLVQELSKNPAEFKKHYPQLALESEQKPTSTRLLSLLDIAYYGLSLSEYMWLLFGEPGWLAQEDPHQLDVLCGIIKGCANVLFDSESASKFIEKLKELTEYCIPYAQGKKDSPQGWQPADVLVQSIEQTIANLEYTLSGQALAAFTLGHALGKWNSVSISPEQRLTPKLEKLIRTSIKVLSIDGVIPDEITQEIAEYKRSWRTKLAPAHAQHVHDLVKTMLCYQEICKIQLEVSQPLKRKHLKSRKGRVSN